jgi:16S rRNA (cytosine1402-N4)-methyltransferase
MDSSSSQGRHKRRPRYPGRNPRKFAHKYKEHDPSRFPETVQKVLDSGKTPAGSHRPIMVQEILNFLDPKPGETAVDATLGYGGHAVEILRKVMPHGMLIGLDQDPIELPKTEARLRQMGFGDDVFMVAQTNYAALPHVLKEGKIPAVDMVLADLGCSSMQLDDPARGFTYKVEGPLDLRMNPGRGRSASALLERIEEEKLTRLLVENADEPHAAMLARAIVEARGKTSIETTTQLTSILNAALNRLSRRERKDEPEISVRRVYQALRIAVNDEFPNLERFLDVLPYVLKPGGRVAILSFHSGEDRRVKQAFETGLRNGIYAAVSDGVLRPGREELRSNTRASSAKLRWAVKGTI